MHDSVWTPQTLLKGEAGKCTKDSYYDAFRAKVYCHAVFDLPCFFVRCCQHNKVEQYSVNKHNGKGWAVESTSSVQAVRDLIERVAPGASNYFEIELFNGDYGDSKLPMMGLGSTTDGKSYSVAQRSELASALNWYLQDYCNSTYDWSTHPSPRIPNPLPLPPKEIIIRQRTTKYSYYMNVCTYGYSLAFELGVLAKAHRLDLWVG